MEKMNFRSRQVCSSFVLRDNAKQCSSDIQWEPAGDTNSSTVCRTWSKGSWAEVALQSLDTLTAPQVF